VLERLPLIPAAGRRRADVVAVMLDAVDVVILRPSGEVPPATVQRLAARARRSGAVLIPLGDWPEADLRLALMRSVWLGLEQGHGRLQALLVGLSVWLNASWEFMLHG
jgi:hypothetical protein